MNGRTKNSHKIFSISALIAVLVLQIFWIMNSYSLSSDRMKTHSEGALSQALANAGEQENFERICMDVEASLKGDDIHCETMVISQDMRNDSLLKQNINVRVAGIGSIITDIVPSANNKNVGYRVILTDAYVAIFNQLWVLILASILTCIAVISGLMEQIRIIDEQKMLADIRNDFFYAMAHDMKSPLTSIMMGTKSLHSGLLDNEKEIKEKYFNIVEGETEHLLALINRLLTISKLENKKLVLSKSAFNIRPIVETYLERYQAKTTKPFASTVRLAVENAFGDEMYIKEAIGNLIDNAVKYSRENINITVSSREKENHVLIQVRDEGIGIPRDEQKVIFDKFERSSIHEKNRQNGVSGFGLGLNYVYQVMRAHGGKVTVNSEPGKFSEFTLYIPKHGEI